MANHKNNPQNVVFETLDAVPSQLWYVLGIASVLISLVLQLQDKKHAALFVGQWPPTFFAIGLYHKLLRPGQENAAKALRNAVNRAEDNFNN